VPERDVESVIESVNGGRGSAARLPFDAKAVFGRARAPVRVTVAGHEPFPTTIASYGGVGWIGFRKAQLAEMGLKAGDVVTLRVELDDEPREVDLPLELSAALESDAAARAAYDGLSFTHRKEYARWIAEAKRDDTRQSRASKALVMLREGIRTPD
jgi:bacteriocin resistance YdeI/OmpD-like protein/uncharacterized protein DUF1905